MEHPPETTGPPPRRGPSVDLDPTGIVTGKSPDRQRRQFLNYSFYRLDPVFRRLPADEQRVAAAGFIELVRKWESVGRPDPPHVLTRGPARGRRLHALADRVRPAVLPVDGSGNQAVAAGRLPVAGVQLPLAAAPVAVHQQVRAPGRASNCCRARGNTCSCTPSRRRGRGIAFRPTRGRG